MIIDEIRIRHLFKDARINKYAVELEAKGKNIAETTLFSKMSDALEYVNKRVEEIQ